MKHSSSPETDTANCSDERRRGEESDECATRGLVRSA
jgi:hypothetical protein